MDKREHITYWKDASAKDWNAVSSLFTSGNYVHALFFAHLTIEKLSKAVWVKDNEENIPPRVHNILKVLQQTNMNLSPEQSEFIVRLNSFQLEGRYPDYTGKIFKLCTKEYTAEILKSVNDLRLCLLNELP